MNITKHHWFAWLSIVGGLLHLLFVSFLHRENFIELWFFTVAGSVQAFLGAYILVHQYRWRRFIPLLIVIHGALIVMWAATRMFPAPFLTSPEAVGTADIVVVIVEFLAVIAGVQILAHLQKSLIAATLIVAFLAGAVNYALAKASEDIFRSIPVSSDQHDHAFFDMFQEFHDNRDGHHDDDMIEHMDEVMDTIMQVPVPGAEETIVVPMGHDNSDGHHDL